MGIGSSGKAVATSELSGPEYGEEDTEYEDESAVHQAASVGDIEDAGTALLTSLEKSHNSESTYLHFSTFLAPFQDYVYDYNPNTTKKDAKPKDLPMNEKILLIARQFNQILFRAIELIPFILNRSRSYVGDHISEERITELLGIYRLTFHCLLCIASFPTDGQYFIFCWIQLVLHLEIWNKFNDALEEGFTLLKSFNTILFGHLKSTFLLLPDPSTVGSTRDYPILAYGLSNLVTALANCVHKSKTMNADIFKGLLELSERLLPWFFIMDPHQIESHYPAHLEAFYNCSLFLAKESKFFEGNIVYSFCQKMFMKSICSEYVERFPRIAYELSSVVDLQWDRWPSLINTILNMSLEWRFCGNLVFKILKLCCKSILVHLKLLCMPHLTNSEGHHVHDESSDLLKVVARNSFDVCAKIIDVFHDLGGTKVQKVTIKSLSKLYFVEVLLSNMFFFFPLVKQWAKMQCKDFSDGKEDDAPLLHTLLGYHCPKLTKNILREILEQELLAYIQLEALNPVLCQEMELRIIHVLLMNVLNDRNFIFQRAWIVLIKAFILRSRGIENSSSCFDHLTEPISLLNTLTFEFSGERILISHMLAFAYLTRAQFIQEVKPDCEGCLRYHFDICKLIINLCKLENISLDKILSMLWCGRRLSHSCCTSSIDPILFSKISQLLDNKLNSITFWTNFLKDSSDLLLMFVQNFFLSVSILDEGNVQQIEDFYSCKLSIENIKMTVLDGTLKSETLYFIGQIYYDLAERLFAGGRVPEALFYAREALTIRHRVLRKIFLSSNKPIETNGKNDHLQFDFLGSSFTKVWQYNTYLDGCILSPWIILRCCLESYLQVGIFYEAMGDGVLSQKIFLEGKTSSVLHFLPLFQIAFSCKLGQLYRKKMLWESADKELRIAVKLLEDNDIIISCQHGKLILKATIDMEIVDLFLKRPDLGSNHQTIAVDLSSKIVRNLSIDLVDSSGIGSWKEDTSESFSMFGLEDTKNMVIQNIKSHPWESDGKSLACSICFFLNNSSQNVRKPISAREIGLPLGIENYTSVSNFAQENCASSFNSGCSSGDIYLNMECLRCLYIKLLKEGTMQNIIYFKWQCQRRRLLLRALLKNAKFCIAPGVGFKLHEEHGVFWQCIFVMFDGKSCFDTNSHGYDLSLFKLMGDNNIGDIFSAERGALLYSMSWFFLKIVYSINSTICCSLSNVQMQEVVSWLLMAFILCQDIPVLFQKVSHLIAKLILLSTVDDSISLPFYLQQSLSISHWAAFFHQASIGSVVNHLYLSAMRYKTFSFEAFKLCEG